LFSYIFLHLQLLSFTAAYNVLPILIHVINDQLP